MTTLKATPAKVNANGDYTSEEFDTTSSGAGAYHWIAHFTGDANNNKADGKCLDTDENTEVKKASPGLLTKAPASVTVGAKISDVATLSGLINPTGAGEVTFDLYKGTECTEQTKVTTLKATPAKVNANGDYTSEEFDTTSSGAGAYHWIAHFTGDANNNKADGKCLDTDENTEVKKASPGLLTKAPASVTVGAKISDVATLSGLINPTGAGEVTFDLYKGTECTEQTKVTTLKATPAKVNANGDYTSEEFDTTSSGAGAYHWIAHFTGDANNNKADGKCLDTDENTDSQKERAPASHQSPRQRTVGAKISDVATLSGLINPTGAGEVTFDLYKGTECTEQTKVTTPKATPAKSPPTATTPPKNSTPPPRAPAPTTGSPTSPATPTTTKPTANASTQTRTPKSKKRAPASSPKPRPRSPSAPKSPTSRRSRALSTLTAPAKSPLTSTRAPNAPNRPR